MHDIDRTQTESNYYQEFENYEFDEMETEEYETVFDEATEMELASDLLEVVDDTELEQFLGSLFKRFVPKVKRFFRSSTGRMLGRALKGAAKKALPHLRGTLGRALPPGVGGAAFGALRKAAGHYFGLELEGLSPEDQEFEVARRFVRFAGDAVRKAATLPPSVDPRQAVKIAMQEAAGKHAPGILSASATHPTQTSTEYQITGGDSGRWIRRGHKIILLGV